MSNLILSPDDQPPSQPLIGAAPVIKVDYTLVPKLNDKGITEYQFIGPDGQPFGPAFENFDDQAKVLTEALHSVVPEKTYDYKDEAYKAAIECWTDEETKDIPMDMRLAAAVATRIAFWMRTASEGYRGAEFYHNILEECGKHIGVEAFTSDDGSIQEDVVALKVPQIVKVLAELVRSEFGEGPLCPKP